MGRRFGVVYCARSGGGGRRQRENRAMRDGRCWVSRKGPLRDEKSAIPYLADCNVVGKVPYVQIKHTHAVIAAESPARLTPSNGYMRLLQSLPSSLYWYPPPCTLLPVPHPRNLGMPHLLLQLKNAKHQRLSRRRATGHIDIHWHNPITTPRHTVAVMVVTTTIRARAHRDDPSRLRHLVVHLTQRGRHLVRKRAGHDHNVGLARRGAENDAHAILVVAGRREVHHFDGAAGEAEGHGPERALAGPVGDLVEGCAVHYLSVCCPYTCVSV